MLIGIILLILVICIIVLSVCNKIKIEKVQKRILQQNEEIEKVICSCNENINTYNTIVDRFNRLYEEIGMSDRVSEIVLLCESVDVKSVWVNIKDVIGIKVFLPNTYKKINEFILFQQNYERWSKKYTKNILERNALIIQRVSELNSEWTPLSSIVERKNKNYPEKIKGCILEIITVLLLNRESNFKLDKRIIQFKCVRGEDFGIG